MLKYLKGSFDLGLIFKRSNEGIIFEGYIDSDLVCNLGKRRSTSSYIFTLCDGCSSWEI